VAGQTLFNAALIIRSAALPVCAVSPNESPRPSKITSFNRNTISPRLELSIRDLLTMPHCSIMAVQRQNDFQPETTACNCAPNH
jgi:hypothetical protein